MATLIVVHTQNYKAMAYLLAIPLITVGLTIISMCTGSMCIKKTPKSQVNVLRVPKNNPKKLRKTTTKETNSHPTIEDDYFCNFCGKNDFVSYGRLLTHIEFEHKDEIQNDDEDNFTENNEKHSNPNKRQKTRQHQTKLKQINVGRPSVPKIYIGDISETDSDTMASNGTVL